MKVEIFTAPHCDYCIAAKKLLREHGVRFIEIDITEKEKLAEFCELLPRVKSIPQVFVDGEHIGSYEDLVYLVRHGRLGDPG